jgi:hypothetical protein
MPLLQAKWSKAATSAFVLYMMSLVAYIVIRCVDIARMKPEQGQLHVWVRRG